MFWTGRYINCGESVVTRGRNNFASLFRTVILSFSQPPRLFTQVKSSGVPTNGEVVPVSCLRGEEGVMAIAEVAFSYRDSRRMTAVPEGKESARMCAEPTASPRLQAELFYRIFCGEDERLQDLAVWYLSEGYD